MKATLGWSATTFFSISGKLSLASIPADDSKVLRKALILGNGAYSKPHDLPSVATNVSRLSGSLRALGFKVSEFVDLSTDALSTQITRFISQMNNAPSGSVSVVYFAGHGLQAESRNYLLGIEIQPTLKADQLIHKALNVEDDWIGLLPRREDCLQVAIIDACRTDVGPLLEDKQSGLNQLEAPPGSIVSFSTQAGRPAIAPADADKLTFYTQALVDQLMELDSFTTFGDLLRLVKRRVYQTMKSHPLPFIQDLAQDPFIAENATTQLALGVKAVNSGLDSIADEEKRWLDIQQCTWPPELLNLLDQFIQQYPNSLKLPLTRVYRERAKMALLILKQPSIRLYKSSFVLPDGMVQVDRIDDLAKSARGDKDAAARIARLYGRAKDVQSQLRYEGWLQFSAGLGNGIAAYELALLYRRLDLPQPAAVAESMAIDLGYVPPRGLGHER